VRLAAKLAERVSGTQTLSAREVDVLKLVAKGRATKKSARRSLLVKAR
jgi:DNA-binding CsgD family transcriptional regulator